MGIALGVIGSSSLMDPGVTVGVDSAVGAGAAMPAALVGKLGLGEPRGAAALGVEGGAALVLRAASGWLRTTTSRKMTESQPRGRPIRCRVRFPQAATYQADVEYWTPV